MSGDTRTLRLLVWNTFLLRPPSWAPRFAVSGLDRGVDDRARVIGSELAGDYDVVALTEVFDPRVRELVIGGFGATEAADGPGPGARRGARAGSGLLILSAGPHIRRVVTHTFARAGHRLFDADAWAAKGVLFVELDVGGVGVEIALTHLIAGGFGFHPRSTSVVARIRAAQVAELCEVLRSAHRPGNVLLVGGDMNTDPDARAADSPDPDLAATFAEFGLGDWWTAHGTGPGWTSPGERFDDLVRPDPVDPRFVDDAPSVLPRPDELQRIDLVFGPVGGPEAGGEAGGEGAPGARIDSVRIRRRGFPVHALRSAEGSVSAGGPARPDMGASERRYLSDHLGLHVEASFTPG